MSRSFRTFWHVLDTVHPEQELLAVAATHRVPRVWIHAITDGRDVPNGTAVTYLRHAQKVGARTGCGRITTVTGRA